MWNAGLDEAQTGIKIAGRNINNLRYTDDTTLMAAESEEEIESLLKRVKEESEKPGLKLSIQQTKMMASGPITSQQIEEEKVEAVADFIFLGSKITVGGDCSREIKILLLLGRKAMTNLGSVLKSRDITLPTKVCLGKAMIFLVVIYECESWTIKKAEHWRLDAFKLWCWRRLFFFFFLEKTLESPLDSKEIKPVNPKGKQPWVFIGKTDSEASVLWPCDMKGWHIGNNPDAGKDWRQKEKGRQRMGWFDSITDSWANSGDGEGQGILLCCRL